MKMWDKIKAGGRSIMDSLECMAYGPSYMAQKALAEHMHSTQTKLARQAMEDYDAIKHSQLFPGHGPVITKGSVYVLQRFEAPAAEPYSVHHLCYKDEMVAVDVAIAWMMSKYEARGITNLIELRERIGIQQMMGGSNLGGYYTLVVSDDGDYWVQITPVSII